MSVARSIPTLPTIGEIEKAAGVSVSPALAANMSEAANLWKEKAATAPDAETREYYESQARAWEHATKH